MDTSASPSTHVQVPVNMSLHVFQWQLFTLIQVLYKYGLPVNFTCMSSFCTGHVSIQTIWRKEHKICINLIYTGHDTYSVSELTVCRCWIVHYYECTTSKIINNVVEYCYFFARHSLDSISVDIVNRHALSHVLVQVTVNTPLARVKLVWAGNSDSALYSWTSLRVVTEK